MSITATPKAWIANDKSAEFEFARDESVVFTCNSQTYQTDITSNDVDTHYQAVRISSMQGKFARKAFPEECIFSCYLFISSSISQFICQD